MTLRSPLFVLAHVHYFLSHSVASLHRLRDRLVSCLESIGRSTSVQLSIILFTSFSLPTAWCVCLILGVLSWAAGVKAPGCTYSTTVYAEQQLPFSPGGGHCSTSFRHQKSFFSILPWLSHTIPRVILFFHVLFHLALSEHSAFSCVPLLLKNSLSFLPCVFR